MKICCVVEGQTEYFCIPTLAGRCGNTVIGRIHCKGGNNTELDWTAYISRVVAPRVCSLALKQPDKIIVVLDRERRDQCPPDLATVAQEIISNALAGKNLDCTFSVVVADRSFESMIFADYDLVDKLSILSRAVTQDFGTCTDGKNVLGMLNRVLKPGAKYDKQIHGKALTQSLRYEVDTVLARSRSLKKLIKELRVDVSETEWDCLFPC